MSEYQTDCPYIEVSEPHGAARPHALRCATCGAETTISGADRETDPCHYASRFHGALMTFARTHAECEAA